MKPTMPTPALRLCGSLLAFGAAALLGLFLLFCLFQVAEMVYASKLVTADIHRSFCPQGEMMVACSPVMARGAFPKKKSRDAFRVFVVGSSQAMGSPYVFQSLNLLGFFFPNEGGISTWLQDYLSAVYPDRRVQVVNAARALGSMMNEHLETFRDIIREGSPDLIVVLAGNNEGPRRDGRRQAPSIEALDGDVAASARRYKTYLEEMVRRSREAGVTLYVLTVPNNLRDWEPTAPSDSGLEEARSLLARGLGRTALASLDARTDTANALRLFYRAKCLDAAGRYDEALRAYIQARDNDLSFFRARSVFNGIVRRAAGKNVRVVDMETILRGYAKDGIPGSDLFHDNCHLKLLANRIAAREIALFHIHDKGLPPQAEERLWAEDSRPLRISRASLEVLYLLKAAKWAEYMLLPRSMREWDANARMMIGNYLQAAKEIRRGRYGQFR